MFSSTPFVLSFALLLSLPLLFLLAPRILPPRPLPISLPDELDDLSLFHKATIASLHQSASTSSLTHVVRTSAQPKIAFLFLTNSDLVFSPLWEKFFHGNQNLYNIYIHADPSTKFTNPPTGVFKDRFIASKKTQRASPTLISAARRLLATALLDDPQNSYFALVSQHCIPLHSFHFFYRSVFSTPFTSSLFNRFGEKKYRSFIEILDKESTLKDRYSARGENVMMPEVSFDQFRVGSQFFILTRKHALLVIKDRKLWRKFRLPCLNTESCYPEEHYFPTLLSMEDPKGCTHFTLTRVNWTDSVDGHPHTYRPAEVSPELIYRLRVSNSTYSYLFARKFSPDCLTPLMDMADTVILRD
ncbi:Glycosyltransferase bc10 [Thalictrum thalictroides]|uniref:Glycosyltransferase bc10 n=1 Tax=Thalictrum thalictroides TaxID=46969 RepID=A0A7J6WBP7_THATH|nr:Glycosyltransferase bc10 [Thalictrum thalictroides]